MATQITKPFIKESPKIRLCQGDILKDIPFQYVEESTVYQQTIYYGVVINQECDLEHDYTKREKNQDKNLPNILVLPAYLASKLKEGTHIENATCEKWSSDEWKKIKKNNVLRFHFINPSEEFQVQELVIDFKHVYTIKREIIYSHMETLYVASMAELYRENLTQRYCSFLGRVGLPEIS